MAFAVERDKRVDRRRGNQNDTAAAPAITTIGTAARDIFFSAHVAHTVATVAACYVNFRFIKEHERESNLVEPLNQWTAHYREANRIKSGGVRRQTHLDVMGDKRSIIFTPKSTK